MAGREISGFRPKALSRGSDRGGAGVGEEPADTGPGILGKQNHMKGRTMKLRILAIALSGFVALLCAAGEAGAQNGYLTPVPGGGWRDTGTGNSFNRMPGGGWRSSDGVTTMPMPGGGWRSSDGITTMPLLGSGPSLHRGRRHPQPTQQTPLAPDCRQGSITVVAKGIRNCRWTRRRE